MKLKYIYLFFVNYKVTTLYVICYLLNSFLRKSDCDKITNLQHKQSSHHEGTEHSQETIDRSRIKTRETWKRRYNTALKWHFPLKNRAFSYSCNTLCIYRFLNKVSHFLFSCPNIKLARTVYLNFLSLLVFLLPMSFEELCCWWADKLSQLTLSVSSNGNQDNLIINKLRLLENMLQRTETK